MQKSKTLTWDYFPYMLSCKTCASFPTCHAIKALKDLARESMLHTCPSKNRLYEVKLITLSRSMQLINWFYLDLKVPQHSLSWCVFFFCILTFCIWCFNFQRLFRRFIHFRFCWGYALCPLPLTRSCLSSPLFLYYLFSKLYLFLGVKVYVLPDIYS